GALSVSDSGGASQPARGDPRRRPEVLISSDWLLPGRMAPARPGDEAGVSGRAGVASTKCVVPRRCPATPPAEAVRPPRPAGLGPLNPPPAVRTSSDSPVPGTMPPARPTDQAASAGRAADDGLLRYAATIRAFNPASRGGL